MDKFEEKGMKKIGPIIRNWFYWLIKQNVTGKKPKIIRDKLTDNTINNVRKLFETEEKEEEEKIIKDKIIRDITTFFGQRNEEGYYEPKRVSNFWNNNYIEYEGNGYKNRNLSSVDEYLYKIESYFRNN